MKRTLTFLTALLLAPLAALHAADAPKPPAKPNIIFLFADDMGWGDLRCYGHPYAQTPNLDRLASEGTRFLQCYATGVTCVPSRAGFMTSRFPARFAKYPSVHGFGARVTVTELLKKQGYATGHFGKWHLGPTEQPGTYGIDVINSDVSGNRPPKPDAARSRDARYFDHAVRFIEKHKDVPFYVNVWSIIPHHPVNPSQTLLDAFGPLQVDESKFPAQMQEKFAMCKKAGGDVSDHMRRYLAEIKSMDAEVGRLLRRLDELGLREKTIVVFSSDQGPAPTLVGTTKLRVKPPDPNSEAGKRFAANNTDDLRLNAMGCAGPFRGGKTDQHEGGIRIPFIVRWPGQVPAGRVDERSVISGADWLPTLCALTGTKINAGDFDGEDASTAWLGKGEHVRTKPLLWRTSSPLTPVAIREGKWKLHYPNSKRDQLELFDIAADPAEQHNLAKEQPDVVKQLSAKLEAWQATLPKEYDRTNDADK
jgi:N-acetylgalactosamine-6-sulfatase